FLPGAKVASVQAHGLEGMRKLTRIDFGDAKITNIDNFAFRFCESLTEFTVQEGVTFLGRYAVYDCRNLKTVMLPETLQFIGRYAFLGTDDCNVYFASETLPETLQEEWDRGIKGYYLGTVEIVTDGDFTFTRMKSGNISLMKYNGGEKTLDLNEVGQKLGGDITLIGGKAFWFSEIESIILPDKLTTIQSNAFYHSSLRSVVIPDSVTFIGKSAFGSTPIETLTFGADSKLYIMEQYAFEYTENLSKVTLPCSLTQIGRGIFLGSGIKELYFGEGYSITEIPKEAFAYTKLKTVTVPDCVTVIWDNAFRENPELTSVHLPQANDLMIRSNAFYHTGLTEVFIPANVTYIGEYAFTALKGLKEFRVDENNKYYSESKGLLLSKDGRNLIAAPGGMTGSFTLPESIETLGFGAFEETSLESISFSKNANILTLGYRVFYNADNITEITIPASVVSIDFYAFANCDKLHSVLFDKGNRMTGVYEGAFYSCVSLQNITLPESIVEISDYAFYGCELINSIPAENEDSLRGIYDYAFAHTGISGELTTPQNLYDIGAHAFDGTAITKLTIPDTEYKNLVIGFGAFENCSEIEEIVMPFIGSRYLDKEIVWFGYIFGAGSAEVNHLYVPESLHILRTEYAPDVGMTNIFRNIGDRFTELYVGRGPRSMGVYSNPEDWPHFEGYESEEEFIIDNISGYNYEIYKNVEKIKLPETVLKVCGFGGNKKLEYIEIPDGVKVIDYGAFSGCASLKEIKLPDTLELIGDSAFSETALRSVILPDNVADLGMGVFDRCDALEYVKIPDKVKVLGYGMFYYCQNLKTVVLPGYLTEIGARAFQYCFELKNADIPNSVTSIGDYAFNDCRSLERLDLPKDLEY
ncbi:MAG: leucine-rich repeat domain-containing protein, partial [Clostridia bacterium]|nr:leucine-rich repeat domain-containing protein [Clostridia bacterium]